MVAWTLKRSWYFDSHHWRWFILWSWTTDETSKCTICVLRRKEFLTELKGKAFSPVKNHRPRDVQHLTRLPVALRASLQHMWDVKNILLSPASPPCIHPAFSFLKRLDVKNCFWNSNPTFLSFHTPVSAEGHEVFCKQIIKHLWSKDNLTHHINEVV